MGYWDYEEPCWEPSEADELFDEIKSKLVDAAKISIKADMESLKSRNEYLEKRNRELEQRERAVNQKERDLEYKASNLRREVENEFYNKAIDELFKGRIQNIDVWFAEHTPHDQPKCNHCDENRDLKHTFHNGHTVSIKCDCANKKYYYEPALATLRVLKYVVEPSRYASERKYYLTDSKSYCADNRRYYDDYSYAEFNILHIVSKFDDNAIELHDMLKYSEKLGFKTKEECQKYCDWRNNKNKEDD